LLYQTRRYSRKFYWLEGAYCFLKNKELSDKFKK